MEEKLKGELTVAAEVLPGSTLPLQNHISEADIQNVHNEVIPMNGVIPGQNILENPPGAIVKENPKSTIIDHGGSFMSHSAEARGARRSSWVFNDMLTGLYFST